MTACVLFADVVTQIYRQWRQIYCTMVSTILLYGSCGEQSIPLMDVATNTDTDERRLRGPICWAARILSLDRLPHPDDLNGPATTWQAILASGPRDTRGLHWRHFACRTATTHPKVSATPSYNKLHAARR